MRPPDSGAPPLLYITSGMSGGTNRLLEAGDNADLRVLGYMALVALVIGTSVSAAATERVTLSLVLTSALAWSFVPLLQLGTGLWLVRSAGAGRRVAALERYFETHRPWSLFILASTPCSSAGRPRARLRAVAGTARHDPDRPDDGVADEDVPRGARYDAATCQARGRRPPGDDLPPGCRVCRVGECLSSETRWPPLMKLRRTLAACSCCSCWRHRP